MQDLNACPSLLDARPSDLAPNPTNKKTKTNKKLTCIDLFAGAGGFSLGALAAGIDVIGALELSKKAALTYAHNIKRGNGSKVEIINDDILDTSPKEALKKWGIRKGACDIIVGGPPCQGFSRHRINDSGVDDPRNKLLARYFEYVQYIRPKIFIVENVPGLLWSRHAEYLKNFYEMADKADYDVLPPTILNACDYGTPQNRKRVFIVGIDRKRRIQIDWPPKPSHCHPTLTEITALSPWVNAESIFYPIADTDLNNLRMNHSPEMIELFRRTPKNGGSRAQSGRTLKCHEGYSGHSDVYGRIDPSKPAPTMTTACINPSKGRFVHPTEDHGLTLRHAARIQDFPDTFIFHGGLTSGGEQIGNAVPIQLSTAILTCIKNSLLPKKRG